MHLTSAYDNEIRKRARYLFGHPKKSTDKIVSVYFVLASDNMVKIGRSANVPRRINDLSVLHPSFSLLGTVTTKSEREVHKIFDSFRVPHTEWFYYDDSMIEFIRLQNQFEKPDIKT